MRARKLSLSAVEGLMVGRVRSGSTLANWRAGRSLPHSNPEATRAVLALERALQLPSGDLMLALRQSTGRGQPTYSFASEAGRPRSIASRRDRLEGLILAADRGRESREGLLTVEEFERYQVGADGRADSSRISLELRALADGVPSYWYVRGDTAGTEAIVVPGSGCAIGSIIDDDQRRFSDERGHLTATELMFTTPPLAGDLVRISFSVVHRYAYAAPLVRETVFRRVLPHLASRKLAMEIAFDVPPTGLIRATWPSGSFGQPDRAPRPPRGTDTDEWTIIDPLDQGYGWTWGWPGGPAR